MTLNVLFLGNSDSVFSQRYFQALWQTPARLVGVVDVPPAKRTSTNTRDLGDNPTFVELARRRDLPVFEPASPNLPEFVETVGRLEPDLLLAVGYTNLLQPPLLAVPRLMAANFHASLLPAYRGKHPVFWALRHGEPWAGLTVHRMAAGLDTGEILYQVRVRTRLNDSVASLYDRIIARSLRLVPRLIADAARGSLAGTPQPEEGASYFSAIREEDFRLDWRWPAEQLRRWIQTSPGQCFYDLAGRRVYFLEARLGRGQSQAAPGALVRLDRTGGAIATGQGKLRLGQVSLDGVQRPFSQLCAELGLAVGAILR